MTPRRIENDNPLVSITPGELDNDNPWVTLTLTGQGLRLITHTHARTHAHRQTHTQTHTHTLGQFDPGTTRGINSDKTEVLILGPKHLTNTLSNDIAALDDIALGRKELGSDL